jgi:F-type H+-transporting ATPase subunit delta
MKISKQARRDAKQLFRSTRVNGVLDEGKVRQVVQQVIALKPRSYVATLTHFQRLVRLDLDRRTAVVESATPLAQDFQQKVTSNLAVKHGPGLQVSFVTNPALIGGLRIKVGSDVYDGSVQGRLANLENNF